MKLAKDATWWNLGKNVLFLYQIICNLIILLVLRVVYLQDIVLFWSFLLHTQKIYVMVTKNSIALFKNLCVDGIVCSMHIDGVFESSAWLTMGACLQNYFTWYIDKYCLLVIIFLIIRKSSHLYEEPYEYASAHINKNFNFDISDIGKSRVTKIPKTSIFHYKLTYQYHTIYLSLSNVDHLHLT